MANEVKKYIDLQLYYKDEAFKVTGCKSGGIPPFGSLFGI